MAINLSDKLTADHSENYIMSIRLRSGGLSFSAYSPSVNESFFYRDVEFDRTRPYVSSLKECFFENDFLTWFYKQVNVVCVTSQYTLVPAAVFQEKQKAGLLAFTFSSPEGRCLSNELKDEQAELVFGVDEDVYEFCSRSLVNPRFVHHVGPLLSLWKKQSRARLPPPAICRVASAEDGCGVLCSRETLICELLPDRPIGRYRYTIYYMYGNRSEWINRKTSCVFSAMCPCEMI